MRRLNITLFPKSPTNKNLILVEGFLWYNRGLACRGGNNPKDPSMDYEYLKLFRL